MPCTARCAASCTASRRGRGSLHERRCAASCPPACSARQSPRSCPAGWSGTRWAPPQVACSPAGVVGNKLGWAWGQGVIRRRGRTPLARLGRHAQPDNAHRAAVTAHQQAPTRKAVAQHTHTPLGRCGRRQSPLCLPPLCGAGPPLWPGRAPAHQRQQRQGQGTVWCEGGSRHRWVGIASLQARSGQLCARCRGTGCTHSNR